MPTTAKAGTQRTILDESYFIGVIRGKMGELNAELAKMRAEIKDKMEDQSAYLSYEKKAEGLAKDLKELQGQLADYNVMNDKLTTHTAIEEVLMERDELKARNDREAATIDSLFVERKRKEQEIKQILGEIATVRARADAIVTDMPTEQRQYFDTLKASNDQLSNSVSQQQQQLDTLNTKLAILQQKMVDEPIKQEALALYEQMRGLLSKNEALKAEIANDKTETPEMQKERLTQQLKLDNQEISAMDRRVNELSAQIRTVSDEISRIDDQVEEQDEEKRSKYLELVKKDKEFQEFLDAYPSEKAKELERIGACEARNVQLLEQIARNIQRASQLPSANAADAEAVKGDLEFKSQEMNRSQATSESLTTQRARLTKDLENVNQLEGKIEKEMKALQEKMDSMNSELKSFGDLDKMKRTVEATKAQLGEAKLKFQVRQERMNQAVAELNAEYEKLKNDLQENETYIQLSNMEKKWQLLAKNNFAMRDYIASREYDTDAAMYTKTVAVHVQDYNDLIKAKRV